jgi:UDP-GlcNAc:undecaprenyl-phosphate GlcNAc-1-phosphate transferase
VSLPLALGVAFFVTVVAIRIIAVCAPLVGLVDRPGGRKDHTTVTPVVGGIAICIGTVAASVLVFPVFSPPVLAGLAGIIAFLILGIVDDRSALRGVIKLTWQIGIVSILVLASGVQLNSLGQLFGLPPVDLPGSAGTVFTIVCIVGVVNAVNMADGVDGLAGGVVLAALVWLGVAAHINGAEDAVLGTSILAAAVVGFLVFNYRFPGRPCAVVFLGDAGSMVLGFAIAWFAVRIGEGPGSAIPPISIAWILALPVVDTLSLMIRRMAKGLSPLSPDREHLHHVFLRAGFTPLQTTNILVSIELVLGGVGVLGGLYGVPESWLSFALVPLPVLHYLFVRRAWRSMRALKRLRRLRGARSRQGSRSNDGGVAEHRIQKPPEDFVGGKQAGGRSVDRSASASGPPP